MKALREKLASVEWNAVALSAAIKEIITAHSIKMPNTGDAAAGDAHGNGAYARRSMRC